MSEIECVQFEIEFFSSANNNVSLIIAGLKLTQREKEVQRETEACFKLRVAKLEEREKVVNLAVDGVHTTQGLQLAAGKIFGEADGDIAKELLCVHIRSIAGNYSDMVSMIPHKTITSDDVDVAVRESITLLSTIGYHVATITFDGHRVNQRWYASLGHNGKPPVSFPNVMAPGQEIFPMFDSVHLFKNAFYQLLNKSELCMPRCPGAPKVRNHITVQYVLFHASYMYIEVLVCVVSLLSLFPLMHYIHCMYDIATKGPFNNYVIAKFHFLTPLPLAIGCVIALCICFGIL